MAFSLVVKSKVMKVLITSARAPVALELARRFGRAGAEVDLVDSVRWPLAGFSRYCRSYHRVPPPRQQTGKYGEVMRKLVTAYDLVIPTCEDVLWLSQEASGFCPDLPTLRTLHNKWLFSRTATELGLQVPETYLLNERSEAESLWEKGKPLVFKPVYSRFATHTVIKPESPEQIPSFDGQWVAQDFWEGDALCSFSVAHAGKMTAHVVYRPVARLGQGAGVILESVQIPEVDVWVEQFLTALELTGQFAFDFIQREDGKVACLECNPRSTSGLHLFPFDGRLAKAYVEPKLDCVYAEPGTKVMLTFPALVADPIAVLSARPRPAVMEFSDWKPNFGQALSFAETCWLGRKVGFLEATTFDICWDESAHHNP